MRFCWDKYFFKPKQTEFQRNSSCIAQIKSISKPITKAKRKKNKESASPLLSRSIQQHNDVTTRWSASWGSASWRVWGFSFGLWSFWWSSNARLGWLSPICCLGWEGISCFCWRFFWWFQVFVSASPFGFGAAWLWAKSKCQSGFWHVVFLMIICFDVKWGPHSFEHKRMVCIGLSSLKTIIIPSLRPPFLSFPPWVHRENERRNVA